MATAVWVGYPNPPIPMLSVHGIEVAGATFPAQIWHDFMASAHGSFCGDFPPPQHPFVSSPFFGRYARTGTSGGTGYGNGYNTGYGNGYGGYTGGSGTSQATGSGGASSPVPSSPSGKGKYNDPSLYETPPQTAPPPPSGGGGAPTPGAGTGNGTGQGR